MKNLIKIIVLIIFPLLCSPQMFAQTDEDGFKLIWAAHQGTWPKSFTREEHRATTQFNISHESSAYKAGIYPDQFREDFRNLDDGDGVIQSGPSTYTFKKFKQKYSGWPIRGLEDLIFGKMYYQSLDSVKKDLKALKIDLSKGRQQIWNGRKVLVFGATHTLDDRTDQIWYDAVEKYPVRWRYNGSSGPVDVQYLDYKKIDGTWFPAQRKEYANSKLVEVTTYRRVRFNIELDPAIFDPKQFGSAHWVE